MLRGVVIGLLVLVSCSFDRSGGSPIGPGRDLAAPDGAAADRAAPEGAFADLTAERSITTPDATRPGDGAVGPAQPFGAASAVVELNSPGVEDDPTLRGDMLEIFFERDGDIWRSTRSALTAPFGPPQKVAALSSAGAETNPELLPDGLTIYLASDRPGGKGSFDIYRAQRASLGASWSAPALVPELNGPSSDHPGPSPDQLLMFVISDRAGGLGEHDFYLSSRAAASGAWAKPVTMPTLNSATQEASPWLSAGALLLYFASSRQGNHDVWLSTRATRDDPFGAPTVEASVSSTASDEDPWLSPDLKTIYFSSDRNGSTDIFVAYR